MLTSRTFSSSWMIVDSSLYAGIMIVTLVNEAFSICNQFALWCVELNFPGNKYEVWSKRKGETDFLSLVRAAKVYHV